ncbi:hypothetical protein [Gemmatimonas sp.]|uniref:hypothetical protein n=1 Tax=Gemmatimonas sp. TaxID=1962908 RepID=UPI00333E8F18
MNKLVIIGYEQECTCDHCGRALVHGVRVAGLGTIGADCFNKMVKANRRRFSGNGKPGASTVRDLAKLREFRSDDYLGRMGYYSHAFEFEAA